MQQKLSVGWLIGISLFVLAGYVGLLYLTWNEVSRWWHLDYFVSWGFLVVSYHGLELEGLHHREHLRGKGRFLLCTGLTNAFAFFIGVASLFTVAFVWVPNEVKDGTLALALLYGMAMLMVCNRLVVLDNRPGVAILNGRVVYPGEKTRVWPFCPIKYKEISGENSITLELSFHREDGQVVVNTGPLHLTRSFAYARSKMLRVIDEDKLLAGEIAWLNRYLGEGWSGLTTDEILARRQVPMASLIEGVQSTWDGQLSVSVRNGERSMPQRVEV